MKVIFLDFDGVLNSAKYLAACSEFGVVIDPARMVFLKRIVDATGAKIVLSTSWREYWPATAENPTGKRINEIFSAYDLQIFDKTPMLHAKREREIKSWLDEHPEVENFVVLDDRLLGGDFLEGHFVKTSNHFDGLDAEDAEKAIAILKEVGV